MHTLKFLTVTTMTLLRIVLALVIIPLILNDAALYAVILFGLTSFLDWMDGYYARLWGVTTPLGALLDPIADKVLVLSVITALMFAGVLWSWWLLLPTIIIWIREGLMLFVPLWMFISDYRTRGTLALTSLLIVSGVYPSTRPPVTDLGKQKMFVQCIALFVLVGVQGAVQTDVPWVLFIGETLWYIGLLAYWIAGYLTFVTGLDYLRKAKPNWKPTVDSILIWCWTPVRL